MSQSDPAVGPAETPVLRVVSGSPTVEEVAVLTALLAAVGSGPTEPVESSRRGGWSDPKWTHRGRWLTGAGAWRSIAR
ncbi:MAG TPA: acyl-CoA carboxylase subunit epsilon [Jatrophihabitans sp.]|jgi:hypothetical protein